MSKVSFDELKALVSITECAAWLGIKLKQTGNTFRGDCPLCNHERSFTLTPKLGLFGCFKCQTRGSVIDLVHHIKQTANIRDAALMLQEHFLDGTAPPHDGTVPSMAKRPNDDMPEGTAPKEQKVEPTTHSSELKPLDYLTIDHEAIEALKLSPFACQALGVGYAPKGTMRGRIVFPMRLPDGTLVAYIGLATTGEMKPLLLIPDTLDARIKASVSGEKPEQAADDIKNFLRVVK